MKSIHLPLSLRFSEVILITMGVTLLISLLFIKEDNNFFIWYIAKGLYGLGAFMFIVNK